MSDNTFYGWKLVAVFFVILFVNGAFPMYGASVINPYMMENLNMDREALGLLFSVYVLVLSLSAPIAAILVNKIGIRFTVVVGSLLLAAGSLCMATFVTTVLQAYLAFGVLVGMGFAIGGAIGPNACAAFWFIRRRALVLSINMVAIGLGGFVAPVLLDYVISASNDNWRMGWWINVILTCTSALFAALFIRNKPSDIGQFPDGNKEVVAADVSPRSSSQHKSKVYITSEQWLFRETVKTMALWLIVFSTMAYYASMVSIMSHGVVHLKDLGHSAATAALAMSIVGICMLFGKISVGIFGDLIEPRFIFAGSLAFMSVSMVVLVDANTIWGIYLFSIFFGIGSGAAIVCLNTVLSNFFGAKVFASVLGLTFCLGPGTGALLGWSTGAYFEHFGSYTPIFFGISAGCMLGALALALMRPPTKG